MQAPEYVREDRCASSRGIGLKAPKGRLGRSDVTNGRLDPLTVRERSELMRRIRSKDTVPEMTVRRLVHGMGYRYRLHAQDLPGCPDLVFGPRRKVIFVHGCFWHRHERCLRNRTPKTRRSFWQKKLDGNARRDQQNATALRELGWRILVIWECEINADLPQVAERVRAFLDSHPSP